MQDGSITMKFYFLQAHKHAGSDGPIVFAYVYCDSKEEWTMKGPALVCLDGKQAYLILRYSAQPIAISLWDPLGRCI